MPHKLKTISNKILVHIRNQKKYQLSKVSNPNCEVKKRAIPIVVNPNFTKAETAVYKCKTISYSGIHLISFPGNRSISNTFSNTALSLPLLEKSGHLAWDPSYLATCLAWPGHLAWPSPVTIFPLQGRVLAHSNPYIGCRV